MVPFRAPAAFVPPFKQATRKVQVVFSVVAVVVAVAAAALTAAAVGHGRRRGGFRGHCATLCFFLLKNTFYMREKERRFLLLPEGERVCPPPRGNSN